VEFDEYVAVRGQSLLRFAYVLTGQAHEAEDLTQNALADLYRAWPRVVRADHPDAYARRAVLNRFLSWRRRRARSEVVVPDPVDLVDTVAAAGDHAAGVADRDELARALAQLPKRARAVLVLRYYADLDDKATAQALGITPSTVRSTTARALDRGRPLLAPDQGDDSDPDVSAARRRGGTADD
jgi:RNA polymerase sigma-70 factor (sigma-E family)